MILPILEYGNALYASAPKSCLYKLQRAQNSGLKAVFGLPKRTPTAALHDKANLDKLDKRRERDVLLMAQSRAAIDKYVDKRGLSTRAHSQRPLLVPNGISVAAKNALGY